MSQPLWQRASCRTLALWALALCGSLAAAHAAPTSTVDWIQFSSACTVKPQDLRGRGSDVPRVMACGGVGSFAFGQQGLIYTGSCPRLDQGSEVPLSFPTEPAPRMGASFPCPNGNCLGRTGRPWVAILDWRTAHGWSVAATIQEASDRRVDVQLYDLSAGGVLAPWVPHTSDLHVLAQLCALAELARVSPGDRPLAVNMSFGRIDGPDCKPPSLCNSVGKVLTHLATQGIYPVAAAGNHHEMLFPAAHPDVISAGALDLSWLKQYGQAVTSMQTPAAAEALMPGYGLYLAVPNQNAYWPAPPGSSYAAALLTGWLSGTLAGGGKPPAPRQVASARWAPITTSTGLALGLDGVPLSASKLAGPRSLLDRALGSSPIARVLLDKPDPLRLTGVAPPLPVEPVLHADGANGPQPGIDPCLPCRGIGPPGTTPQSSGTLIIDLGYSGALPAQMNLVAVFLRVGKQVYAFDGSRDPALLAAVAAGGVESLALTGVGGLFPAGEQPSLVLAVNVGGIAYWHEVPVHMH